MNDLRRQLIFSASTQYVKPKSERVKLRKRESTLKKISFMLEKNETDLNYFVSKKGLTQEDFCKRAEINPVDFYNANIGKPIREEKAEKIRKTILEIKNLPDIEKEKYIFIGKELRDFRKSKGLTQEEIALLLKIKKGSVSQFENRKPISATVLKRLEELGFKLNKNQSP